MTLLGLICRVGPNWSKPNLRKGVGKTWEIKMMMLVDDGYIGNERIVDADASMRFIVIMLLKWRSY